MNALKVLIQYYSLFNENQPSINLTEDKCYSAVFSKAVPRT